MFKRCVTKFIILIPKNDNIKMAVSSDKLKSADLCNSVIIMFGVSISRYGLVVGISLATVYCGLRRRSICRAEAVPECAKWNINWDGREPADQAGEQNDGSSGSPSARRHIILIRHGQYELNAGNDSKRVLTDLGRLQAAMTGFRLKELGMPYTRLIRSTLTRAQETGCIISFYLPDVPVYNCPLLTEGIPALPEPAVAWVSQTFPQHSERIEAAFHKYIYRADSDQMTDSYDILVCHANVIRYLVCRALQIPGEAWMRFGLEHASITWLCVLPCGRVFLQTLGCTGHIPPNKITS